MRVAIVAFHHETNTFSPIPADLAAFTASGVFYREELTARYADSRATLSGFLQACREAADVDTVPLLSADLTPCGTITDDAFEALTGQIIDALGERGPFDVVLLAQHGAAVSERHLDVDGELAARVRSIVGPRVTIGLALDLHANVTERMIDSVDVCVGYRDNPHRDSNVRGRECARLAMARARSTIRPVQHLLRLPMVVPILGGWTGGGAMRQVMEHASRIAEEHALLSYTVFHGFGYADVPEMGSSVLTVADENPNAAAMAGRQLAECLWDRREALRGDALEPAEAVAEADRLANGMGTVVILDVGDNIGAGAPGDSTVLLAEALERNVGEFVATLCDPKAVGFAIAAGVGATLDLTVGRTTSVSAGPKLQVRGRIDRITDGRFEDSNPTHAGTRFFDGGPTVRLTTARGQYLVISTRAVPSWSPEQLRVVGIEPRRQRVIVAKGVVAPRAGYEPHARHFLVADTPGITTANLSRLNYARGTPSIWPLKPDAQRASNEGDHRVA